MRTGAYMAVFAATAALAGPAFAQATVQGASQGPAPVPSAVSSAVSSPVASQSAAQVTGKTSLVRAPALQSPADLQQQQQGGRTPEWYERFTFGSGFSSDANSWATSIRAPARLTWSPPKSAWGVTVDVESTEKWTPLRQDAERDRVAAGAFVMVTPRVRVGGEMGYAVRPGETTRGQDVVQPSVKLESAFRF